MKKVMDLMEKVNESKTTRAKVKIEAASLKTNYDIAVRQLVEAEDAAKKALEAQRVLMEKNVPSLGRRLLLTMTIFRRPF